MTIRNRRKFGREDYYRVLVLSRTSAAEGSIKPEPIAEQEDRIRKWLRENISVPFITTIASLHADAIVSKRQWQQLLESGLYDAAVGSSIDRLARGLDFYHFLHLAGTRKVRVIAIEDQFDSNQVESWFLCGMAHMTFAEAHSLRARRREQ